MGSRATVGFSPWRFVDDDEYEALMAWKPSMAQTRFGDAYNPEHVEQINKLTRRV